MIVDYRFTPAERQRYETLLHAGDLHEALQLCPAAQKDVEDLAALKKLLANRPPPTRSPADVASAIGTLDSELQSIDVELAELTRRKEALAAQRMHLTVAPADQELQDWRRLVQCRMGNAFVLNMLRPPLIEAGFLSDPPASPAAAGDASAKRKMADVIREKQRQELDADGV